MNNIYIFRCTGGSNICISRCHGAKGVISIFLGILEGVISTLFDHPQLKYVKKPILVGAVVLFR